MTDAEKVQYLLSVVRTARHEVLSGDLQSTWNALYVAPEVENTRADHHKFGIPRS